MKKLRIGVLFVLVLLANTSMAQDKGVNFETDLSWGEMLGKAKQQGKYVMVDFYTTWCAPCKHLDANVFPKEEVGDFFNEHFINFKIQMDKKKEDSDYTKSRYSLADSLHQEYKIMSYPTFLFFDGDGVLLHKVTGAGDPIPEFIDRISTALDPKTQYFTIINRYRKSDRKDLVHLKEIAHLASDKYEKTDARELSDEYLIKDRAINKENIEFARVFNTSPRSEAFKFFRENRKEVNRITYDGDAESEVLRALNIEFFEDKNVYKNESMDWKGYRRDVAVDYPEFADMFTLLSKVNFSDFKNNWMVFEKDLTTYIKKYGETLNSEALNSYGWSVARNLPKSPLNRKILNLMKRLYTGEENYMVRQTQACLIYAIGDVDQAIKIQEKAVSDAHEFRRKPLVRILEKMKKGEPIL